MNRYSIKSTEGTGILITPDPDNGVWVKFEQASIRIKELEELNKQLDNGFTEALLLAYTLATPEGKIKFSQALKKIQESKKDE